jgi:hypothetical protein
MHKPYQQTHGHVNDKIQGQTRIIAIPLANPVSARQVHRPSVARMTDRPWTQHAIERACERYGIQYKDAEWWAMIGEIIAARAGEPSRALFVGLDPERPHSFLYQVPIGETVVKLAYDADSCCVVTVLPRQVLAGRAVKGRQHQTGRLRRERARDDEWE